MAASTPSTDSPATAQQFHLKVFSPFEIFVDTVVSSLSAENETGPFDVLAGHASFLTLLVPCQLRVVTADSQLSIPIERAVLHVHDNTAIVFMGI